MPLVPVPGNCQEPDLPFPGQTDRPGVPADIPHSRSYTQPGGASTARTHKDVSTGSGVLVSMDFSLWVSCPDLQHIPPFIPPALPSFLSHRISPPALQQGQPGTPLLSFGAQGQICSPVSVQHRSPRTDAAVPGITPVLNVSCTHTHDRREHFEPDIIFPLNFGWRADSAPHST